MDRFLKLKKILGVVVFLNILIFLVFYFLLASIQKNNNEILALMGSLSDQIRKEATLKMIRADLKSNQYERAKLNSYFVESDKEKGVSGLIGEFESLGGLTDVVVETNSVFLKDYEGGKINGQPLVESVILDITAKGNWNNLVWFMSLVQALPLNITIDRMIWNKIEKDKSWHLNIIFSVLKLK